MSETNKLRKVGAMWKPREGSKAKGSGEVTVNGLRQKFVIFTNDYKKSDREPDYVLMSSNEPEVDSYAVKNSERAEVRDADVPF